MREKPDFKRGDQPTIRNGFRATPTFNGGWVLSDVPEYGLQAVPVGAFTNDDDLIDFIIASLKSSSTFVSDGEQSRVVAPEGKPDGE